MVNITKVYTKTGDKGMTHLAGGKRVSKTHLRVEVFGSVDELNSYIGWVVESVKLVDELSSLKASALQIQQKLFDLGASVAVLPEDRRENTPYVANDDILWLEADMDRMNETLSPLKSFILPGGGEVSSRLHIARSVCRRAERDLLRLLEQEAVDEVNLPYLNRLSDWLFVAARFAAMKLGEEETLWQS